MRILLASLFLVSSAALAVTPDGKRVGQNLDPKPAPKAKKAADAAGTPRVFQRVVGR